MGNFATLLTTLTLMDEFIQTSSNTISNYACQSISLIAAIAATVVLGTSLHGEDETQTRIRRRMESDAKDKTRSLFDNPPVRRGEMIDKLSLMQAQSLRWSLYLVGLIVLLTLYLIGSTWYWYKKQQTWQTQMDARLKVLEDYREQCELGIELEMECCFNDFERAYQEQIDNDNARIKATVEKSIKKLHKLVEGASNRIESVKKAFLDLIETDDKLLEMHQTLARLGQSVGKMDNELGAKYKKLEDQARTLNGKVHKYIDETESATIEMRKSVDTQRICGYKSQIQLVNAQILFDTALSKFEVVENSIKAIITGCQISEQKVDDSDDPQRRLEKCLARAIETRQQIEALKSKHEMEESSSRSLSQVLVDHSFTFEADENEDLGFVHFKIYADATDLALADLNNRIIQLEATKQTKMDEIWYSNWISGIYAMLNADSIQLQAQILGKDRLEGIKQFETAGDGSKLEDEFVTEIADKCTTMCLDMMRSISLLVLESHLANGQSEDQVLQECKGRVKARLLEFFSGVGERVRRSSLGLNEKKRLETILRDFEKRLHFDLDSATIDYISLFKQNVEDFYMIQGTLKDISTEEPSEDSNKENQYCAETTNSMMDSILSTSSDFRPLKLSERRQRFL